MSTVSAAAVLDLWERAERASPIDRAVALAAGDAPLDDVAALPVGHRDARLLQLYAALGGGALEATAECPACAAQVEFAPDVDALLALGAAALDGRAAAASAAGVDGRLADGGAAAASALGADGRLADGGAAAVSAAGVEWRLPDSRDLAAAAAAGSAEGAERVLLERCAGGPLTPRARAAVARAMAEADPLAEVLVDLACPDCGAAFVADLDVASFVWTAVRAHAQRVLGEIDALARAYGWTEPQILALSEPRRRTYLRLARGELA
jgi:hypothetical protein